jgi:hypothetical protein
MSPDTQTAYKALTDFKNSAPSAQSLQSDAYNKYNVNGLTSRLSDLQTGVNNLSTSLNNVDPSVTGRLQGNFATTAQRSALISKEQAPIASNLNTENQQLNQGEANLNNARTEANNSVSAQLSDQAKSYQQLLDSYNASEAHDQFVAQMAEKKREADMAASGGSGSGGGYDIGSILGALTGSGSPGVSASKAGMVQRAGGGFNFTDTKGNAISAGQYAKATGQNIRDLLTKMAQNGDQGAKTALGFVGNDFGYDPNKIGNNSALYNALMAGTGRKFTGATVPGKFVRPLPAAQPVNVTSRLMQGFPGMR